MSKKTDLGKWVFVENFNGSGSGTRVVAGEATREVYRSEQNGGLDAAKEQALIIEKRIEQEASA